MGFLALLAILSIYRWVMPSLNWKIWWLEVRAAMPDLSFRPCGLLFYPSNRLCAILMLLLSAQKAKAKLRLISWQPAFA